MTPPVAVVTGASRGAGLGIAEALGAAGWRVYLTGRTVGTAAARTVSTAGGEGIAVQVDHRDDAAVKRLFEQVRAENGQLQLLVNNAAAISDRLTDPAPFWDKPIDLADVLDVGLRSAYVASWYAAPLLLCGERGLIAFTSSPGSVCYMHGPAYGAQKSGLDKFAADMGVDFEGTGCAAVSLWLGPQITERTAIAVRERPDQYSEFMKVAETPQFNGRVIEALARDPQLAKKNGQTLVTAELAVEYDIQDEGGRQPPSYREMLGPPRIPHPAKVV